VPGVLAGKRAVVTGGSRGIGEARAAREFGVESFATQCDVSNPDAVTAAFEQVRERFGSLEVCVNNAGIVHNAAAEDLTFDDWSRMLSVNLGSVFLCSQAAGRIMLAQSDGGSIINVSSICAHVAVRPQKQCHYQAAKGGVNMLTKSLAAEWADRHVRVNTVSPGYVNTALLSQMTELHPLWEAQIPMNRLARPQEIAAVITFLASDGSSYVTGSDFVVDGGYLTW